MTIDMSQFYQVFFDETAEHLAAMESLLLNLDLESPDVDELNAIFRAAHSIKGGSGTFGFSDMTEVTHVLETLLDRLRKGELQLREEMVDTFLEAGDVLKAQLEGHQHGAEVDEAAAEEVCGKLKRLAGDSPETTPGTDAAPASPAAQTYRVRFTADPATFPDKGALDGLLGNLATLGTLEVLSGAEQGAEGSREVELTLTAATGENEIRDILAFFLRPEQIAIETAGTAQETDPGYGFFADDEPASPGEQDPGYGFFTDDEPAPPGEKDPGYGFFTDPEEMKAAVEQQQGYGFFSDPDQIRAQVENEQGYGFFHDVPPPPTHEAPAPTAAKPGPAGVAAKGGRRATDKAGAAAHSDATSIRVSVEKVDQLINLVGELVITQAMLAQTASEMDPIGYERLHNGMAQLERNTRDLQDSVMSIRMMPISFVFSRYPRVVRDVAGKFGKQVELKTVGEGTELDRGLIEKISDPLTHLVRNSLDHGIETPEKRRAAGKDAKGVLTLRASHQGGNIVIEVMDDGAGLNRERILNKAREKGLPVNDGMSDQEVWQLIFAPGFSTAEVVTDVSGRGVGMDVVKKNIEGMGGRVEIESEQGFGTKITIRLPLTLAILDGMSVAVGQDIFILPLSFIIESLQPPREDVKSVTGEGRVVHVRGEYLPLIALHRIFNIRPKVTEPHQGILVIIEAEGSKVALFVDELVGQHQVVIKSLESNYRKVAGISGATIMGDGKVALIVDPAALVRLGQSQQVS